MQWRVLLVVFGVTVGSSVDQQPGNVAVAFPGRLMQRGPLIVVPGVNLGAFVVQQPGKVGVALPTVWVVDPVDELLLESPP